MNAAKGALRKVKEGLEREKSPTTPLYQMVVSALKTEIVRGVHPVGAPLPSEAALMNRFGVSRFTIREALRHLRDLGLVESRQGVGSLVLNAGGPQVYVHHVNSIADLHDFKVQSRYSDTAEPVTLDARLAERLNAKPGETWLRIDGLRFEEHAQDPICVVEIYVPSEFGAIGRLLGRRAGPIYSLIEAVYGESMGEVEQDLRAVPAKPELAERLAIQPGDALVEIRRQYRLLDSRTAEVTFNYYNATKFSFSMKLRRVRGEA